MILRKLLPEWLENAIERRAAQKFFTTAEFREISRKLSGKGK